jgi:hypothetical protein
MSRSLNPAANPLRVLLLFLALALLAILVVGFNAAPTPLRATGSHLNNPFPAPAPNLGSQPPVNASENQATQAAAPRVIVPASQQPAFQAPAATPAPAQAVPYQGTPSGPTGGLGCPNPPPGRMIASCSNP